MLNKATKILTLIISIIGLTSCMTAIDLLSPEDQKLYSIQQKSSEKLILIVRSIETVENDYADLENKASQLAKTLILEKGKLDSINSDPEKSTLKKETSEILDTGINILRKIKETSGNINTILNSQTEETETTQTSLETLKLNLNGYKLRAEQYSKKMSELKERLLYFDQESENSMNLKKPDLTKAQQEATI